MPHITQVAATSMSAQTFSSYVVPKKVISEEAQRITGITMHDKQMYSRGLPVASSTIGTVLSNLLEWLRSLPSPVVLAAHNGRRFDGPVLMSALVSNNMEQDFIKLVSGLCDTINVLKKKLPGLTSYSQEFIMKSVIKTEYNAHDAAGDVAGLLTIFNHSNVANIDIVPHTYLPISVIQNQIYLTEKHKNVNSLHPLVGAGILKMTTAENIAGSGLNYSHLLKLHQRGGEESVRNVFLSKSSNGKARVTSSKKLLDKIIPELGKHFSQDNDK